MSEDTLDKLTSAIVQALKQAGNISQEKELLNREEVAHMLGVAPSSVYKLHDSGKLPLPVRLNGSVRWRKREMLAWIDAGLPAREKWEQIQNGQIKA